MTVYRPISTWLNPQGNQVRATFKQIERILGFDLPVSARTHRQWWENDSKHAQGKAWLDVGFHTTQVNLTGETVVFVR